jgi:hypothetical protein
MLTRTFDLAPRVDSIGTSGLPFYDGVVSQVGVKLSSGSPVYLMHITRTICPAPST